jgi:hypothetical protein
MAGRGGAGRSGQGRGGAQRGGGAPARTREPSLKDEIAASGETPVDEDARAAQEDRDDLGYVGREFLTWLAYHADVEGGLFEADEKADVPEFTIHFGGRVGLQALSGVVRDVVLKGSAPASSPDLRYALAGGLSVKEAELLVTEVGADPERSWRATVEARTMDLRGVKLPALLAEEDEARLDERLHLLRRLDRLLEAAFGHFLTLRAQPAWRRRVVPALREWLVEGTQA